MVVLVIILSGGRNPPSDGWRQNPSVRDSAWSTKPLTRRPLKGGKRFEKADDTRGDASAGSGGGRSPRPGKLQRLLRPLRRQRPQRILRQLLRQQRLPRQLLQPRQWGHRAVRRAGVPERGRLFGLLGPKHGRLRQPVHAGYPVRQHRQLPKRLQLPAVWKRGRRLRAGWYRGYLRSPAGRGLLERDSAVVCGQQLWWWILRRRVLNGHSPTSSSLGASCKRRGGATWLRPSFC